MSNQANSIHLENTELVVFSHIPKTAGTSLLKVIEDNYAQDEVAFLYGPEGEARRDAVANGKVELGPIKCLCCHQSSKITRLLTSPYRVFSMVRHPVDYNLSLFHYLLQNARSGEDGMKVVKKIRRKGWSLEDLYHYMEGKDPRSYGLSLFFNAQSQVVCNMVGLGGKLAPAKPNPVLRAIGLSRFFDFEPIKLEDAKQLIDQVLAVWQERHYVLGTTESFEASVSRFAQAFGWQHTKFLHENKTARPRGDDVSEQLKALIIKNNQADMLLWEQISRTYSDINS